MRALITRPRAEAEALARLLAERGIEPVIEPLMEVADNAAALPDLAGVQAFLCTSANGVRALARASKERRLPLFTVGEATAASARAEGFRHVESAGGDVEDLAFLAQRRLDPRAGKLLHVVGSAVAGDLAGALAAGGFTVERAALYEARGTTALSAQTVQLIADGSIDIALFFSPRTAAIFARLVDAAEIAAGLRATTALSISRPADAMLDELPFRERRVARAPNQAALLDLIGELVAR